MLSSVLIPLTCNGKAIFSTTVLCGSKAKLWNTIPILFLLNSINSLLFKLSKSCPSIKIFPSVASVSLDMHLSNVDLPEPDKPITTNISPFATSNEALLTPTMHPFS